MARSEPVQTKVVQVAFVAEMVFILAYLLVPDLLFESRIIAVTALAVVLFSLVVTGLYSVRWLRYRASA